MGNFVSRLRPQERDCVGKDFLGAALGRWGTGCDFLNDQKVTKESPGDGSDERLRAAGAHSHLSPGPPFYEGRTIGGRVVPIRLTLNHDHLVLLAPGARAPTWSKI